MLLPASNIRHSLFGFPLACDKTIAIVYISLLIAAPPALALLRRHPAAIAFSIATLRVSASSSPRIDSAVITATPGRPFPPMGRSARSLSHLPRPPPTPAAATSAAGARLSTSAGGGRASAATTAAPPPSWKYIPFVWKSLDVSDDVTGTSHKCACNYYQANGARPHWKLVGVRRDFKKLLLSSSFF
mmetsp:Transcript_10519/g.14582  ORF Transcript_10519/g.14582 Transcript_10519/m.14582 type:complete len:187 (-) Transcript_10519:3-563(-)